MTQFYEDYKKIRRNWGEVKPTTKVEKDKTKYNRKEKHKTNFKDDDKIED